MKCKFDSACTYLKQYLWFPGNLIADSMINQNLRHPDDLQWNDVSIAIVNGGGIRASIDRGE